MHTCTAQCVLFRRNYKSVPNQYGVHDPHAERGYGFVHDNLRLLML
jgi:hypothetical protein